MVLRYSATISSGRRRRASLEYSSASPASASQHLEVPLDDLVHPGPQYLDHDFLAALQPRRMHLRDGGRGERRLLEALEHFGERPSERPLDGGDGDLVFEGRYAVLKLRQLIGDIGRNEVAPGRYRLAEFDEDRPELLEGEAQALSPGHAGAALKPGPRGQKEQEAQGAVQMRGAHEIVEAMADQRALNHEEAGRDPKLHHGAPFSRCSIRARRASTRSAVSRRRSTP